jgi:hypothetical protein
MNYNTKVGWGTILLAVAMIGTVEYLKSTGAWSNIVVWGSLALVAWFALRFWVNFLRWIFS